MPAPASPPRACICNGSAFNPALWYNTPVKRRILMDTIFHKDRGISLPWLLTALGILATTVALAVICL